MRCLVAAMFLLVSACNAGGLIQQGPDPQAGHGLRVLVHVSGDFDGQVLMEQLPLTALIKGHGNATITGRAYPPPLLTIDGDRNLIIEPQPGREAEAVAAIQAGHILIRRNGVHGALNRVGSARAWKASWTRPAVQNPPAPPPPTEPAKPVSSLEIECETEGTLVSDLGPAVCTDPEHCGVPGR